MRVAGIHIGSNSIHMLTAAKDPQSASRRLEEHTEVARLAEGLDADAGLPTAAIARAATVFGLLAYQARAHGEEEGALTVLATLASVGDFAAMRVLDSGGASTELMRWQDGQIESQSIDVGVVPLLERFVHEDPACRTSLEEMQRFIALQLHHSFEKPADNLPVIGVGGTITSSAALDLGIEFWDPENVQGYRLKLANIVTLVETLWPMCVQERCDILRVDPRRADVIGVGASFLHAICEHLQADEIIVSDRGVRWGRVYAWDEKQHGR